MDLPSSVVAIDDAMRVSLKLAKELLETVNRYCVFEGLNKLIIEYRNNGESMKLINAKDPSNGLRALLRGRSWVGS